MNKLSIMDLEEDWKECVPNFVSTTKRTPLFELYLTTLVSALAGEIIAYPFDVWKTRMHIQGEIASKSKGGEPVKYRGMFKTAMGIIREEGFFKLYNGMSAMALRHATFSGYKMYFYDTLRERFSYVDENGKYHWSFARSCLCGMSSGALANFLSSPVDMVKIQMQMDGLRVLKGEPPRVKNVFHAFGHIYKQGGIKGLWKGTCINAIRAALVTLGDTSAYDLSKRKYMIVFNQPDNRLIQFMGAMTAGFTSAVLSTPADVVKSRIMNQPVDEKGRGLNYKGTIDCFVRLLREEGIFAMYKGFMPYWLRVGPWAMVFWTVFENIRRLRGDEGY